MMEDEGIIALYFQRSEDAIAQTDKKYGGLCRQISLNILQNRQDSEECVSDTYLHTWNAIPPQRPTRFSAFLARIVRNLSINRLKFNTRKKRCSEYDLALEELSSVLSGGDDPQKIVEARLLQELLEQFVCALPDDARLVFMGRYWHFDPVAKIAKKTGFSQSKVKMLLLRTRESLRTFLQSQGVTV